MYDVCGSRQVLECVLVCVGMHVSGNDGEPCVCGTLPLTVALVTFMATVKSYPAMFCHGNQLETTPTPDFLNGNTS